MEHPRLGVQAGRGEVVGDPDVGTEVGELVEGAPARSSRCRWSSAPGAGRSRSQWRRRASSRGAMPLRRMKAMTTSMRSADSISDRSWFQRFGSPGALVSSVVSSSGISGSAIASVLPSGRRPRTACSTVAGIDRRGRADRPRPARRAGRAAHGPPRCRPGPDRRRRHRRAHARSPGSGARRCGRAPQRRAARRCSIGTRSRKRVQARLQSFGDEDLVQPRRQLLHAPETYELSGPPDVIELPHLGQTFIRPEGAVEGDQTRKADLALPGLLRLPGKGPCLLRRAVVDDGGLSIAGVKFVARRAHGRSRSSAAEIAITGPVSPLPRP